MPILDTVSLTDDDYDYLESVLDQFQSDNAMNLEMVDGQHRVYGDLEIHLVIS